MKNNDTVILYTKKNCVGCARLRYLLSQLGISFQEQYVNDRPVPQMKIHGIMLCNPDLSTIKSVLFKSTNDECKD